MPIKLSEITKDVNKYHYYIFNKTNKKLKLLTSLNNSKEIYKKLKKIKKINNKILVRVKLQIISKKQYNLNKKSTLKLIGGPLYGSVKEYQIQLINRKIVLKSIKSKVKNKVYFSKNYLIKKFSNNNRKWITKDLNKIALYYVLNKLNFNLMAVNLVHKLK